MDASSELLWQCPPVITNIFKFLCARDLSRCAKVCSLWNNMAITENNRRRSVEWFLEDEIGEEGSCIPLVRTLYPFQRQVVFSWCKPSFCLAFVTVDMLEHVSDSLPDHLRNRKRSKSPQHSGIRTKLKFVRDIFLEPLLPARCHLHCIAAPGIIGCHDNGLTTEVEGGRAIAGLLIPDVPGVYISHCSIENYHLWFALNPPDRPIKGMLAFVSNPSAKLVPAYIDEFVKENGAEFAVGGAVVEPVLTGLGSVFLFTGENVQVASVVIGQDATDVAVELALFRKTGLLENRCYAFMFSCVGKGVQKYKLPDFESNIFRKMYPDVPLVGVFGNGEVGNHFLPNVDKEDLEHKKRCEEYPLDDCLRAYSSVFVLVSVKVPK